MSGTERTTIVRLQRGWLHHLPDSGKPKSTSRADARRMTADEASDVVTRLTLLDIYARAEAA